MKRFGIAALLAAAGMSGTALGAVLFGDNFDADHTGSWTVNNNNSGLNAANFFFDYSTVGIPSAPHSTGGSTRESSRNRIGGGASRLVDHLLNEGFENVTVLDLSETALTTARNRLGERGSKVKWITSDVTTWEPGELYEIWHDRAALHFLTEAADQASYVKRLKKALRIDGHAIIGTFALDGPEKCSGLPVVRHDANSLSALLGPEFVLIDTRRHEHTTPSLSVQKFLFSTYHRQA